MASYLYKIALFKPNATVADPPPDNVQNREDFENNHKAVASEVDEVLLSETTFVVWVDYATFEAFIDGETITWADVKYINNLIDYQLNLLVDVPL